jgi:glycine hydroxymethyltransferase
MTSRGLKETDFEEVAGFLHEVLEVCKEVQGTTGKAIKDFVKGLDGHAGIADIRSRVEAWASRFSMPGFSVPASATVPAASS